MSIYFDMGLKFDRGLVSFVMYKLRLSVLTLIPLRGSTKSTTYVFRVVKTG